jgi:TfoX/Sxy family transcriptional regulator of competence genes
VAYNEQTAERLRAELESIGNFTEKKMFGGVSFLLGGNMAIGVVRDELCVRVGPEAFDEAVELPGARIMDFTRRPLRGWVFVAPEGFPDRQSLAAWVKRATDFARTLPNQPR